MVETSLFSRFPFFSFLIPTTHASVQPSFPFLKARVLDSQIVPSLSSCIYPFLSSPVSYSRNSAWRFRFSKKIEPTITQKRLHKSQQWFFLISFFFFVFFFFFFWCVMRRLDKLDCFRRIIREGEWSGVEH